MSEFDDRVRFYFRHQPQIDEWAALRAEAARAVDDWLSTLGPAIDELGLAPDLVLDLESVEHAKWPMYRLSRKTWSLGADTLAIGLEWVRGKTILVDETVPYVGLRAPQHAPIGAVLRTDAELVATRSQKKDKGSAYWPAYRYVAAPSSFPDGADAYQQLLLVEIRAAWETYAPIVDRVVASLAA